MMSKGGVEENEWRRGREVDEGVFRVREPFSVCVRLAQQSRKDITTPDNLSLFRSRLRV